MGVLVADAVCRRRAAGGDRSRRGYAGEVLWELTRFDSTALVLDLVTLCRDAARVAPQICL